MQKTLLHNLERFDMSLRNSYYKLVYCWFLCVMTANNLRRGVLLRNRVENPLVRRYLGVLSTTCILITIFILFFSSVCEGKSKRGKSWRKSKKTKNLTRAQLEQMMSEKGFNPLGRIRSIAIAPCYNLTDSEHLNGQKFSEIISSELSKIDRFDITFPEEFLRKGMEMPIPDKIEKKKDNTLEDGTETKTIEKRDDKSLPRMISDRITPIKLAYLPAIAKTLDVDALLIVYVKEYDPYNPPKITLTTKLVLINTALFTVGERQQLRFEDLSEYGLHPGLVSGRKTEKELLWKKTIVYDASFVKTKQQIKSYAKKNDSKERPLGFEFCTNIIENYFGFISFDITRRLAMATDPETFEKQYREYEKELEKTIANEEREQRRTERALRRGKN